MEESQFYQWLHLLGLLALSYLVLKQVWTLLIGTKNHILSRWWRTNLKKKYGGWAVVTGATDGIGKSYAKELARRGFDVVLISRNAEKLQKVAQEIEKESRRKTKIIPVDFTGGPEIYPKVEKALKDLDIGILVNNVGMNYHPDVCRFLEVPDINKRLSDIMNCNVLSMVHMTRIVLPRMVERKKGLIINLSSAAGARPYPVIAMYGATKVFMDFFSRSLYYEYRSDGITVQSVLPHFVSTNMTGNISSNILVKTSDDYVREALNTVGYTHRTNGCLSHCFQSYILDHLLTETFMNSRICIFIAGCAMSLMIKILKIT
ncbi:very-long-chain 3-oxoacyl-CoA reductase-like isoform X3 [Bufo gargarizans]|uniref:very-long-chain 3-oxoacyl-CoA reductase-like isoform X3 n=1 Tax=Bufo gargarizans TaxID=30331 RepID=UPI001CF2F598|nr:very-long-chain 3-oxoacyl-CoA reductase-like isoform X3 [Bufo gargarizans]